MSRCSIPNTFGVGSPSWNLPFPEGNLTAAETMAYTPHWLKSIDVLRRFLTNAGDLKGLSKIIADMVTKFRHSPYDNRCNQQSIYKMIGEALRRTRLLQGVTCRVLIKSWQADPHRDPSSVSVTGFRCPRVTHPKTGNWMSTFNNECPPIQFRDLARHVREHPSGSDALDLTKCVHYALHHPGESWLLPTDYAQMVQMLGGQETFTHAHTDRQVFVRPQQTTGRRAGMQAPALIRPRSALSLDLATIHFNPTLKALHLRSTPRLPYHCQLHQVQSSSQLQPYAIEN